MVICKYFLRGGCRFGDNCKNEHIYSNETATSILKKKTDVDPNILIKAVSNDMDKADKGNQWPLSCYGPFQYKPCFPNLSDKSFEEVRIEMYDAEKNGTLQQYKQQFQMLVQDAKMKMRSLQNPTAEAINVLRELFAVTETQQQSTNAFGSQSVFGNAATHTNSVFASTYTPETGQSIFSAKPVTTNSAFTFALPENKNIFCNQVNNTASTFPTTNNSIFGVQSQASVFGTQQQQQNFATNNLFQSISNQNPTNTNSIFVSQIPTNQPITSNHIYTSAPPPSYGTNTFDQSSSPFAQNPGAFSQNQSPFGSNQSSFNQNPFGQTPSITPSTIPLPFSAPNSQNLFTNASNNVAPNQNPFTTQIPASNSIFPTQTLTTNSTFAPQTSAIDHSRSIFGTPAINSGLRNMENRSKQHDPTIYSLLEDLSENDIKSFESQSFEFGKIPEKPPTLQMCP